MVAIATGLFPRQGRLIRRQIRAAGRGAGTLVTAHELRSWLEKGVQFFYGHSDHFLRLGLNGIKKSLGR